MSKRWSRGEFCWYELGTTDVAAAKNFYGSLFGWSGEIGPPDWVTVGGGDGMYNCVVTFNQANDGLTKDPQAASPDFRTA